MRFQGIYSFICGDLYFDVCVIPFHPPFIRENPKIVFQNRSICGKYYNRNSLQFLVKTSQLHIMCFTVSIYYTNRVCWLSYFCFWQFRPSKVFAAILLRRSIPVAHSTGFSPIMIFSPQLSSVHVYLSPLQSKISFKRRVLLVRGPRVLSTLLDYQLSRCL